MNNSLPLTKLLSSDARKSAALAISSGRPILPAGAAASIIVKTALLTSSDGKSACMPGVETAPGASTLTRMRRGARSWIQLRAKLRIAALVALYTLNDGPPLMPTADPVRITDGAVAQKRQRFLNREERALDVGPESPVIMFFGNVGQRHELPKAGVREQDVNVSSLLAHDGIQPVKVGEIGDVALHPARTMTHLGHRFVEFGLSTTRHEHASTFACEEFCACQADPAVGACDDRDLAFKLAHFRLPYVDGNDIDRWYRFG